jgi:phosphomevalonate kinase
MRFSAPGKLVLLGDYAVTEGATALVAAVDRRATGVVDAEAPSSAVVDAVLARAKGEGHAPPAGVRVDTSVFHAEGGDKLGFGSSAAVATVTAALATGAGDDATYAIALEGHRDAAGGVGSGVDVAACFHGGVLAAAGQPGAITPLPSALPGLHLGVVYAGESASTADLVRRCRASARWPEWARAMTELAAEGIDAWRAGRKEAFLSVVARYGRAMAGLGRDAAAPVVTEPIDALMRLAGEGGGAAKPSGAGGGDVVVVFSEDPELAPRIAEATGSLHVSARVDRSGLRRARA